MRTHEEKSATLYIPIAFSLTRRLSVCSLSRTGARARARVPVNATITTIARPNVFGTSGQFFNKNRLGSTCEKKSLGKNLSRVRALLLVVILRTPARPSRMCCIMHASNALPYCVRVCECLCVCVHTPRSACCDL